MQLANEISGFAGLYLTPAHQLVAYVKDATITGPSSPAAAAASSNLSGHLATDGLGIPRRSRPTSILILRAEYDFQTLSDYRDIVSDSILGTIRGVVSVDLDEAINRVTIGLLVFEGSAESQVTQRLHDFGVPIAAIHFVRGGGIRPSIGRPTSSKELRTTSVYLDAPNPDTLAAGLSYIDWTRPGDCTVGAVVDSGSARRFVSASHCTSHIYAVNNDSIAAPGGGSAGRYIGRETADPPGTTSCTFGGVICWKHRSSDAALFSFSSGLQHNRRGVIARPASRDSVGLGGTRDTVIDTNKPWLFITDTLPASSIVTGEELDHIGWASGWHYGTVDGTCIDVEIENQWGPDGQMETYCEDSVTGYGYEGDSGGPAFAWDGEDGVVLVGIENAANCQTHSCGTYDGVAFFFSNWSSVLNDLGMLGVANNTTFGTPSVSGSFSNGLPQLSWSAVSTTNTTATTEYRVLRDVWDASTYTWAEQGHLIGSTTSTSFVDNAEPFTADTYTGQTQPAACAYTFAFYAVQAYNSGAKANSLVVYFRGPANGPHPDWIQCP